MRKGQAISDIKEQMRTIRNNTGRTYKSTKWGDYNHYQYLCMKLRVLEIQKNVNN